MTTMPRILVVDDEPSSREYTERMLKRVGYHVVAVEDGETALDILPRQSFDLALVDLVMPGINGMEVLAALRQQAPDTVVIMCTAHASLETAVEALRQGAHDYLFKPCRLAELRESVRTGLLKRQEILRQRELLAQLEQAATGSPESQRQVQAAASGRDDRSPLTEAAAQKQARFIQKGPLIVDLMRRVITLSGRILELSPIEFSLMTYLVIESPRTISPKELMREVYGYESDAYEAQACVRQHICNLRRKIRATTKQKNLIRTVRGKGYALEPDISRNLDG